MDPSKGTKKSPSGSSGKSSKKPKSSPEHHHHQDSKLWQAKEQVLGMPSPRREYRECVVDTSSRSLQHGSEDALCCGHGGGKKKGEGFSRMAVLYFLFFSCVFVVAIIGLRMFTIEDRMLRLDTDYQQQQMRIEALEEMVRQLRKVSDIYVIYK